MILAPCIKSPEGMHYVGKTHALAQNEAKAHGVTEEELRTYTHNAYGYLTDTKKFLSREEALIEAKIPRGKDKLTQLISMGPEHSRTKLDSSQINVTDEMLAQAKEIAAELNNAVITKIRGRGTQSQQKSTITETRGTEIGG